MPPNPLGREEWETQAQLRGDRYSPLGVLVIEAGTVVVPLEAGAWGPVAVCLLGVHGSQGKRLKGSSAFRENAGRILNPRTIYPVLPSLLAFLPVSSEAAKATARWHLCCQIAPSFPLQIAARPPGSLPSLCCLSSPPSSPSSGFCLSLDQAAELPWLLRRALAWWAEGSERGEHSVLASPLLSPPAALLLAGLGAGSLTFSA